MISLFADFGASLFYEIYSPNYSAAYGSAPYWYRYAEYAEEYLYSGRFNDSIASGLLETGAYLLNGTDESFEEFADSVYDDYNLEEVYFEVFDSIYIDLHQMILAQGQTISETSDITGLVTDWMRYVHTSTYI